MSMVTSQIWSICGFTKTQKSKYLENETLLIINYFLFIIKKFINYTSKATLWQKILL